MIEAIVEGIFQIGAELLFDGEVIAKTLGWVGAGLAWVLTLGRCHWEADDWQAVAMGGFAIMIVAGVGADAWIQHSHGR